MDELYNSSPAEGTSPSSPGSQLLELPRQLAEHARSENTPWNRFKLRNHLKQSQKLTDRFKVRRRSLESEQRITEHLRHQKKAREIQKLCSPPSHIKKWASMVQGVVTVPKPIRPATGWLRSREHPKKPFVPPPVTAEWTPKEQPTSYLAYKCRPEDLDWTPRRPCPTAKEVAMSVDKSDVPLYVFSLPESLLIEGPSDTVKAAIRANDDAALKAFKEAAESPAEETTEETADKTDEVTCDTDQTDEANVTEDKNGDETANDAPDNIVGAPGPIRRKVGITPLAPHPYRPPSGNWGRSGGTKST
jgi:hypothetical protein